MVRGTVWPWVAVMKRLIIGGLAALAIGLGVAPVAQAHPCSPEPVCHEFDWARPYYDAFERYGIGYLAHEIGIPLINQADRVCAGKPSRGDIRNVGNHWRGGRILTVVEVEKVIEAAYDVCPEMAP
jgi:hypothetical protein